MAQSQWTSLEVAKLAVGVLTPLLLLALGVVINSASKRVEQAQWANQKIVERRLKIYDEMAPLLNDLFCFYSFVGNYKELEPPAIVQRKRTLDKLFHINRPLFSAAFHKRYSEFMDTCFDTYAGAGLDAKIRSSIPVQQRDRSVSGWKTEWERLFATGAPPASGEVLEAYEALMSQFAAELGVGLDGRPSYRPARFDGSRR